jgi:hypothetical protein
VVRVRLGVCCVFALSARVCACLALCITIATSHTSILTPSHGSTARTPPQSTLARQVTDLIKALTTYGRDVLTPERAAELVAQLEPDAAGLVNYNDYVTMMMDER